MAANIFSEKCFCVVTGGSRGLGPAIVSQLSQKVPKGSHFLLLARQQNLLEKNCAELSEQYSHNTYKYAVVDNSTAGMIEFQEVISNCKEDLLQGGVKSGILVHNSGSIGYNDRRLLDFENLEELQSYFNANLNSVILLTTAFMKECNLLAEKLIINISSGAAVKPCAGIGIYSVGKAARKMYCEVLAAENEGIKVLNYSPGPLKTDMLEEVVSSKLPEVQPLAQFLTTNGITVEKSASKLMTILERNDFVSGSTVHCMES